MWHTLAEEQSQHFNRICEFWVEDQVNMDTKANDHQAKQERLRTRWTAELDKIFADIVVVQIQQGNRTNNVFDKKTWNQIREEFNRQTNLSFNNNQLRKHLDVLRTRYHNLQSAFTQNDTMQEDPCYVGFDLWEDIGAQSKIEPAKTKECPIYEQLCIIFADSGVDGKYAQSSHYEELDKPAGIDPSGPEGVNLHPKTPVTSKLLEWHGSSPQNTSKNTTDKKRKRLSEAGPSPEKNNWNEELGDAMADAILDMINSSKLGRSKNPVIDERFTISNCIKVLDEIEGIGDDIYYAALDLFENPSFRETFISLKSNYVRLTWLQQKCGNNAPMWQLTSRSTYLGNTFD